MRPIVILSTLVVYKKQINNSEYDYSRGVHGSLAHDANALPSHMHFPLWNPFVFLTLSAAFFQTPQTHCTPAVILTMEIRSSPVQHSAPIWESRDDPRDLDLKVCRENIIPLFVNMRRVCRERDHVASFSNVERARNCTRCASFALRRAHRWLRCPRFDCRRRRSPWDR